jgi:hypothetical protein
MMASVPTESKIFKHRRLGKAFETLKTNYTKGAVETTKDQSANKSHITNCFLLVEPATNCCSLSKCSYQLSVVDWKQAQFYCNFVDVARL